jgi:exopolyphosphatase/guanosine-5'-triphosphate,3'-diphosphate pyrophosphatase
MVFFSRSSRRLDFDQARRSASEPVRAIHVLHDRRRVDGIWLSRGQIDSVIGTIMAMDYEARAKNPCIGRERADLVLAGCAILEAIRKVWPSERLRVADRGLREGILNELMHEAGVWRQHRAPHGRGAGTGKAGSGRGNQ